MTDRCVRVSEALQDLFKSELGENITTENLLHAWISINDAVDIHSALWSMVYGRDDRYSEDVNEKLDDLQEMVNQERGNMSDGYHTFNELYEFRKVYNAALFNEWATKGKYEVHKSKRHFDGEECFGGGWFIVVAVLPTGQISNHYPLSDWELFICDEEEKARFEFDGHTSKDVIDRLTKL